MRNCALTIQGQQNWSLLIQHFFIVYIFYRLLSVSNYETNGLYRNIYTDLASKFVNSYQNKLCYFSLLQNFIFSQDGFYFLLNVSLLMYCENNLSIIPGAHCILEFLACVCSLYWIVVFVITISSMTMTMTCISHPYFE